MFLKINSNLNTIIININNIHIYYPFPSFLFNYKKKNLPKKKKANDKYTFIRK